MLVDKVCRVYVSPNVHEHIDPLAGPTDSLCSVLSFSEFCS